MTIRSRRRLVFFLLLIAAAFLSLQLSGINVNDFDNATQIQENVALPTSKDQHKDTEYKLSKMQGLKGTRNTQQGQHNGVDNRNREIILQNENTFTNHDRHDFKVNGDNKLHLRNLAASKLLDSAGQDRRELSIVSPSVTNRTVKHGSDQAKYEEEIRHLANGYQTVPPSVLQEENCPVCFGTSLCDELYEGNIKWDRRLSLEVHQHVRKYNGTWIDEDENQALAVTVKQFSNHRMLDNYICQMTSATIGPDHQMRKPCDVSSQILKTKLATKNAVQQNYVRKEIGKLQYRQNTLFSLPRCASQHLLDNLVTGDHQSDYAMLSTAMILSPHMLTLKFIHSQIPQLSHYFPSYYGECGHTVIQQREAFKPLRKFLPEDWFVRVNLAHQILEMVEDFQTASPDWMVVFGNITYNNLAISQEGAIKVIDLTDVMIVDKMEINQTLHNTTHNPSKPCNEECLFSHATDLAKDPATHCGRVDLYAQVMDMLVCQRFLSDLQSTKVIRFFDYKNKDFADHAGGLLRNPPYELDIHLADLLYECVFESKPGQRKRVFNTLKKMLRVINRSKIGSAYW